MITLRPYQNDCVYTIIQKWAEGVSRQLISLPTGCGKTITFAELTKRMNGKTLVIAHTDELVNQAIDKILKVIPDADIGKVKALDNEHDKIIVVASIQTVSREQRLEQLKQYDWELCICDEAHHAAAESYTKVFESLGFMSDERKLLAGFTATPKRGDGKALAEVFQEITYEKSILDMIKEGHLCDLRGKRISTGLDLKGVKTVAGDFSQKELSSIVDTEDRNELIVNAYMEHGEDRKAIAFCVDVEHSKNLSDTFNGKGIAADSIYGDMQDLDRKDVLKRFQDGQIQVLTNCMVLTEGFDEPSIQAVLMARPTRSDALYTQCVGRGTRLYPGKKECLILDFTDIHNKILSLGTLIGKDIKNNQSLIEVMEEESEEETTAIKCLKSSGILYSQDMELFDRSSLNWNALPGGHFRLSIGNNKYIAIRNNGNGRYDAILFENDLRLETLIENVEIEFATGVAEDYARKNNRILTFVDKNAAWRKTPATEGQLNYLAKLGYKIDGIQITKGQASELIDNANRNKSARKLEPPSSKQIYFLKGIGQYRSGLTRGEASKMIAEFKCLTEQEMTEIEKVTQMAKKLNVTTE